MGKGSEGVHLLKLLLVSDEHQQTFSEWERYEKDMNKSPLGSYYNVYRAALCYVLRNENPSMSRIRS